MNLKTKKLIIGFGASISVVAPVATVVACGSENEKPQTQVQTPLVQNDQQMGQNLANQHLDKLAAEINDKANDFKGYELEKFMSYKLVREKKMYTLGAKLSLNDIYIYSAFPVFGTKLSNGLMPRTRGLIPSNDFVKVLSSNNRLDFLLDVRNVSYIDPQDDTSDYKVAKKPSEFASLLPSLTATNPLENLFATFLPTTYDITQNQDYSELTKHDNLTTSVSYASDDDANTLTATITLKSDHGTRVITKTIDKVGLSNDDIKYYSTALEIYQLTNDHPELFELTTTRSDIRPEDAKVLIRNIINTAIIDGRISYDRNFRDEIVPEFYPIYNDIVSVIPFTQIPTLPNGFALGKMTEYPTGGSYCSFEITHNGVTIPVVFNINGFKQ